MRSREKAMCLIKKSIDDGQESGDGGEEGRIRPVEASGALKGHPRVPEFGEQRTNSLTLANGGEMNAC